MIATVRRATSGGLCGSRPSRCAAMRSRIAACIPETVAFGSIWPVLMSSIYGFSNVRVRLQEVSAVLGLTRLEFLMKIAIPSALPDILAGMRTGLAVSLGFIVLVIIALRLKIRTLGH